MSSGVTAPAAGACARSGAANSAAPAAAAEDSSNLRLDNVDFVMSPLAASLRAKRSNLGQACMRGGDCFVASLLAMTRVNSHAEDLHVVRLDLLAQLLDRGGVLAHGLDLLHRLAARLLLGERVHGAQAALVDDELLAFGREAVGLEQPRRVGIRGRLEHRVRPTTIGTPSVG